MKAADIFKTATELYRDEVSGGGAKIDIPELGMNFYVFPQQPLEGSYIASGKESEYKDMRCMAARVICGRAKLESGVSLFDNENERENLRVLIVKTSPRAFNDDVAVRVMDEINQAYPTQTIEAAGNESEDATSSDSISA